MFQDTTQEEINKTNLNDEFELYSSFNWVTLITICLGALMVVIDETIVNVALPSIKAGLGFTDTSLAWVVNAYLISFGGFLLLTGRIGDIYGNKKLFLIGIASFTLFSFTSGIAFSQTMLLLSRIGQGISGAIIMAISLSLIVSSYQDLKMRAKAMGVFGAVLAGGGSVGVFLGGLITDTLGWHWIFFINLPIGICVFILIHKLITETNKQTDIDKNLDYAGAIAITLASLLAVYGIVNGNEVGWVTFQTIGTIVLAIVLAFLFIVIEYRSKNPLIPPALLKIKTVVVANAISMLWAAGMFALFFLSALYMQLVLNYNPLDVGLAFLAPNVIMAIFSIAISEKLVNKFGIIKTVTTGLFLTFLGLLYFARAPVNGQFIPDILPSMLLFGFGPGIAFNPLLLAAVNGVDEKDSGLASSLINMSFVMGGALGLAILSSTASIYTKYSLANDLSYKSALNAGYNVAFFVASILIIIAIILGLLFLRMDYNQKITD